LISSETVIVEQLIELVKEIIVEERTFFLVTNSDQFRQTLNILFNWLEFDELSAQSVEYFGWEAGFQELFVGQVVDDIVCVDQVESGELKSVGLEAKLHQNCTKLGREEEASCLVQPICGPG